MGSSNWLSTYPEAKSPALKSGCCLNRHWESRFRWSQQGVRSAWGKKEWAVYWVWQGKSCWSEESVGRSGVRYVRWAKCWRLGMLSAEFVLAPEKNGVLGGGVEVGTWQGSQRLWSLSTSGLGCALARLGKDVFVHLCAVFTLFPIPTCIWSDGQTDWRETQVATGQNRLWQV